MRICVIQPGYSFDASDLDARFGALMNMLDECDEARRYFEMGIDTVLTNDYLAIKNATEQHRLQVKHRPDFAYAKLTNREEAKKCKTQMQQRSLPQL